MRSFDRKSRVAESRPDRARISPRASRREADEQTESGLDRSQGPESGLEREYGVDRRRSRKGADAFCVSGKPRNAAR